MNNHIVITGAAGFIGRYVAKEFFKQGFEVHGMGWGKFPEYTDWGLSAWYECDISMETLCEFANKPIIIIHCAGAASVGHSIKHPRQDFCQTVDTTSHILEYIRLFSPKTQLIYPSTAAVYGQVDRVPIVEDTALVPVSPYGIHKLMVEALCKMYSTYYGLSITIVRFFSIYGDGLRKQLLWEACNKISNNDTTFFGTGEEVRDWLHVTDAVKLLVVASKCADKSCTILNGGAGVGVSVKDVLQHVMKCMDTSQIPTFSKEVKSGDPNILVGDITQARNLNWSPKVDWKIGISNYVKWYKKCR